MIKVIVKRRVKKLEDIWSLLRELRAAAINEPGYVSGETLQQKDDPSTIITISTWTTPDSWKVWEKSPKRESVYRKIKPFLSSVSEITVYEILGTGK